MAFNADEYISVIVEQIGENFQELHKTVEACKKLNEDKKKFRSTYELIKYAKLDVEINEQKTNLADVVCNKYKSIESLSVGLFGEWGSGKTHLLKLIESSINSIQLDENASKKEVKTFPKITIPVFFNAWRFEKEEHMIIPLFQTMLTQLEEYEHIPMSEEAKTFFRHSLIKFKVLGKALLKGLKVPEKLGEVPTKIKNLDASVIGDILNLEPISKEFEEKIKEELVDDELFKELTEESRLESVYYKIPEWIEKITISDNINFVFLIDDLDRCLPENTLKMLESIKLFLDVPSCAFVLAIDDDVVERGVAYHYRDYLQQNNNVIINLNDEKAEKGKEEQKEIPITGHEYLEKMIQLPFRIPVIGTDNVLDFLTHNYKEDFKKLLKEEEDKVGFKEFGQQKEQKSKTDEILEFFSKTIPAKPRKIKRTAMLFQTKIKLLDSLGLEHRSKLIAKITLLELFAPKLLRFIQNNGYESIYNRLVYFRGLEKKEENETSTLSLSDVTAIEQHIADKDKKIGYTAKEQALYGRLVDIIKENRSSRMIFDLDYIFDKRESEEDLKLNIEMSKQVSKKPLEKSTFLSEVSMEKLFRTNDATSWEDAFKDNKLLASGEAFLSDTELNDIVLLAKEKVEFAQNPEWMGIVAKYVDNEQYIKLLKALYDYRFSDINGKFKMGIYQVTFAEYDRYCELIGNDKVDDNEWGRGKRPIMNVSWDDATKYAKWLKEVLKVDYRLPSSDDWLLACANGKTSKWHFGDKEKELKDYAWYRENSEGKTHPVGEKKPNELGLYDMHGNVWEWCEDWHEKEEKKKVLRGGWWDNYSNYTGSAYRYRFNPSNRSNQVGFRLQRTLA